MRYLFCITPGRSGSDYLAEILGHAEGTVALHEAFPMMNGRPMQRFNDGDEAALSALMPLKWKEIEKARGTNIYCETNHTFIKGWGWLVPDVYADQTEIGVLVLRREPEKNVYSLLRLRDVPGTGELANTWYLKPDAARNLTHPSAAADPYELCQWYVQEIEHRSEQYRKTFPAIRYFDCTLEQLNQYDFVCEMLGSLGLRPQPTLREVVGRSRNRRTEWPRLSVEELFESLELPSADDLPGGERDRLLRAMIDWLRKHRAEELRSLRPNQKLFGTIGFAANACVANAERELEKAFQVRLRFTEFERILIAELVHALKPHDFCFLVARRKTEPHLHYLYDFNFVLSLSTVYRRLGLGGVARAVWHKLRGGWRRDPSHHVQS